MDAVINTAELLEAILDRLPFLDLVLATGEAAEFDTRTPHWFGAADDDAVEFLSLFGKHGERAHLRARPKAAT